MTISTMSAFFYGHDVTELNYALNFDEGSGELLASVSIGDYTPEQICDAVASAMNSSGTQEYTVAFDRDTRKITISAASNFSLLIVSGTSSGLSIFSLLGFTGIADLTGAKTYTGASTSGSAYFPQIPLQNYTSFANWLVPSGAKTNVSADGSRIEVVSFGEQRFMEFELPFITDIDTTGSPIEYNATGVSDYIAFIEYAITKSVLQFIPDRDTPETYDDCILESTVESKEGTAHKLKEMYSRKLPGYYDTGKLVFRKVT